VRNPACDQVAIVGVGHAPYTREPGRRSLGSQAAEACIAAIRDAGLTAADIDGVCGSSYSDVEMQVALGLPSVTWSASPRAPFGFQVIEAVNAVFAGACTAAVVYHSTYRAIGSRERHDDPVRRRAAGLGAYGVVPWKSWSRLPPRDPGTLAGGIGYASWAQRYLDEFGATRDVYARIALNNRTNAAANENAVMREPITFDDYYAAPMIREPLGLLDLDVPVDGADAFVVTTTERAADLTSRPVLVHAATTGRTAHCREDQLTSLHDTGQDVVARTLWAKSDLELADVDVFLPYDGFTMISALWIESVGYCARGEAEEFVAQHWDADAHRILIHGRVPVNPHGGNLSEGATQGSGAVREAVVQLRGEADGRQVAGAETALVTPGGIVWNAGGLLLRTA
jgi:acetyl-CoA acetyltransferase